MEFVTSGVCNYIFVFNMIYETNTLKIRVSIDMKDRFHTKYLFWPQWKTEINKKGKTGNFTIFWKFNNTLLNNQWIDQVSKDLQSAQNAISTGILNNTRHRTQTLTMKKFTYGRFRKLRERLNGNRKINKSWRQPQ